MSLVLTELLATRGSPDVGKGTEVAANIGLEHGDVENKRPETTLQLHLLENFYRRSVFLPLAT